MSSLERRFLAHVAERWRKLFPKLSVATIATTPVLTKGSVFACRRYEFDRNRTYFFHFDFCLRRRGEFMLGIVVSDDPLRPIRDPAIGEVSPSAVGSYSVAAFSKENRRWALVDVDANASESMKAFGFDTPRLPRSQFTWYPETFGAPEDQIFDSALVDVEAILTSSVFPKLQVDPK